jgi:hypothetical protein
MEESQNDHQMLVCDAGDKRSNVQGRSHAMDAASESFLAYSTTVIRRSW